MHRIFFALSHFREWWRYHVFNNCPECNSDGPHIYTCDVCKFSDTRMKGATTEYISGNKHWWDRFVFKHNKNKTNKKP